MIKYLHIQNLVLIDQMEISFHPGFNVMTGETGSGKSALIYALGLIAGERADTTLIRHGEEKGTVEAAFEVENYPEIFSLLEQAGITQENDEDLIIRREVSLNGKNRIFINNQLAQLTLLRSLGQILFELVGQHASQSLFSTDFHRDSLDAFGSIQEQVEKYRINWKEENSIQKQIETLHANESQRMREIDRCQVELEEIESAQLKSGEEEELFSEYSRLQHIDELKSKCQEIQQTLSGERQAVLPILFRQQQILDQIGRLDPSLAPVATQFQSVLTEIQEVQHTIRNYSAHLEADPERLQQINERLTLIDRLKRRYGASIQEIQNYQQKLNENLQNLNQSQLQIDDLQSTLHGKREENKKTAEEISLQRKEIATKLARDMTHEIQSLNMSKAEFFCNISEQVRSEYGKDRIEFFLCPNIGEKAIPLKDCASGGEISRILLALQTKLAGRKRIPTLIFDEIDANIGGETASIVGEKLQQIGTKHQILCVTHFPQVAKHANKHLKISKNEKNGRTITSVDSLEGKNRQIELQRMRGES